MSAEAPFLCTTLCACTSATPLEPQPLYFHRRLLLQPLEPTLCTPTISPTTWPQRPSCQSHQSSGMPLWQRRPSCQSWPRYSKASGARSSSMPELWSLHHKLLWSHWPHARAGVGPRRLLWSQRRHCKSWRRSSISCCGHTGLHSRAEVAPP